MYFRKRLARELLFFASTVAASLLLWVALAIITEQRITAEQYLYIKEKTAFLITVGFFYFIRLNVWMIK